MLLRPSSKPSTTPLWGLPGPGGVPEVSSGIPSPPISPPLAATNLNKVSHSTSRNLSARRGGAAYTITGECERLFCETLRAVFLGEGNMTPSDSLVTGMPEYYNADISNNYSNNIVRNGLPTPPQYAHAPDGFVEQRGVVKEWCEIYDYAGGALFRGFTTGEDDGRTLFVFFDERVTGRDLKPGLMAILELCDTPEFNCSRLVVSLDRATEQTDMRPLMRDLGWVGFEPSTLDPWTRNIEITSKKWFFMSMDV